MVAAEKTITEEVAEVVEIKVDVLKDVPNYLEYPWPYDDNSVMELTCAGVFEYIAGKQRGRFMDEVYRVLSPEGKAAFMVPYWNSARGCQDFRYEWPPVCEQSFIYFNKGWREANKIDMDIVCDFDFCIAPDTLVLTTDLRWVRADAVKVGDSIVGVDEFASGRKYHRRTLDSTVEFTRNFDWQRVRVVTDRGVIVTTPEHPFLARTKGQPYSWIPAAKLKPTHSIKYFGKPWREDFSDSWLSGIYDGEGCIVLPKTQDKFTGVNLTISQKPGLVLDRSAAILESELGAEKVSIYDKGGNSSGCKTLCVCGISESFRILGKYRPIRLMPKVREIISSGRLGMPNLTARVLKVERLDDGPVVAIRTSTRTLITNGFVSHNTYGYSCEAETAARNEESRSFYIKHYTNCVDALHLMLTKRP
jgi:hypothetical protein